MLYWIIVFFILAVIASFFGFRGLASDFSGIARFLAAIFIILFIASLIYSLMTGHSVPNPT